MTVSWRHGVIKKAGSDKRREEKKYIIITNETLDIYLFFSSTKSLPRVSSSPQPKISLMFQTNDSKPKGGGARGELRRSRVQVTQRTWNADIMWVTHHGTRTSPATATFDSLLNSSSLLKWRMVLFLVFCCILFIFCQTRWEYAWSVEMWSEGGWEWRQNWWKKKMLRDVDSIKDFFFLLFVIFSS